MPTCSTGLGEQRYYKARGDFKKAQQQRKVDVKRFAKKGGYQIRQYTWQRWVRLIEKINR